MTAPDPKLVGEVERLVLARIQWTLAMAVGRSLAPPPIIG